MQIRNSARFGPLGRPGFSGGGGVSLAGANNFSFGAPSGFGGVGSFNNFNSLGRGFGGGFNSFANPYGSFGSIGSFGGGAGAGWGQFFFLLTAMMPQILQGLQGLFQGRRGGGESGGHECGGCSGAQHHDNNSGHPDMSYQDGQEGYRIDEAGVNMSFDTEYHNQ